MIFLWSKYLAKFIFLQLSKCWIEQINQFEEFFMKIPWEMDNKHFICCTIKMNMEIIQNWQVVYLLFSFLCFSLEQRLKYLRENTHRNSLSMNYCMTIRKVVLCAFFFILFFTLIQTLKDVFGANCWMKESFYKIKIFNKYTLKLGSTFH